MSIVRFIGCLHLGHENIAKHRGFVNSEEHDETLVNTWNSTVHKKDTTYILGDITMETADHYWQLDRLSGIKHVILGNHDRRQDVLELLKYVHSVSGVIDYKGYSLTHVPIHPNEVQFYKGNIHAHIHHVNKLEEVSVNDSYLDEGSKPTPTLRKYFNVDAKLIHFKPKTLLEL